SEGGELTDAGSIPAASTNQEGLDSLQALLLCANPRVARGSGRCPCGCQRAQMGQFTPFPGQPSLFSLFALRVVARPNPAITRAWRGLSVVNHGHRLADKPLRIEPIDHPPLLDPVQRQ